MTGYAAQALDAFGDHRIHNDAWATTNMVASLLCGRAWCGQGPVIVSYSDIFFSSGIVSKLMESKAQLAIAYDPQWLSLWAARFSDPLSDAETLSLRSDGSVQSIGARPRTLAEVEGQYMGLLRIDAPAWEAIEVVIAQTDPEVARRLDMTSLLQLLIAKGLRVMAVKTFDVWGECDSASDLAVYERWIAEGRLDA